MIEMFQCGYSTEVSGHYEKSLKEKALQFVLVFVWVFFFGGWGGGFSLQTTLFCFVSPLNVLNLYPMCMRLDLEVQTQ